MTRHITFIIIINLKKKKKKSEPNNNKAIKPLLGSETARLVYPHTPFQYVVMSLVSGTCINVHKGTIWDETENRSLVFSQTKQNVTDVGF